MGGDIDVTMVGDPSRGRRDVRLDSKGGDVTLTLPDGLSMEIEIVLAYTKKSGQDYEIESDFELEVRRSANWEYDDGQPRTYMDLWTWIAPATCCWLPATVAPAGRGESGLPVGVQIVGPYLEDRTPLDFAARLSDVIGGFEAPNV